MGMDVQVEHGEREDFGTMFLYFGREEGMSLTYDDRSLEVRVPLSAPEARAVRAALKPIEDALFVHS